MHLELSFTLSDVKKTIHKWLYLEDDTMVDIMTATFVANLFQSDPLWTMFIAPPSHAKTELLRAFDGHKGVYFLSNLTPSTLISGKSKKNPSLLPRLNNKTLVLKDFGTILVMRSEAQQEILAQLREVYDGQYSKAFGNRNPIEWKGHMGFMGAATPVFDRHYAVISALGDRFLLYRARSGDNKKIGKRAQQIVGQEEEMRGEIKQALHKFIDQFDATKIRKIEVQGDSSINDMMIQLGSFCASARCPVHRNWHTKEVESIPESEGPARLIKQFTQMSVALALVHGKNCIDIAIYELIKRLARDLLPRLRLRILKYIWEEKIFTHMFEWRKTREIAEGVNMPTNTVKIALEDLMMLELLNRKRESDSDTAPYEWQMSEKCYEILNEAEVFKITTEVPF